MRNFFIAIVLTFSCAAHSIAAKPAVGAPLKPVYCQIRLLEGKPDGSEAQGTLKVLAEPILVTTETREGVFVAGGEMDVPGTDEKLPFGTNLQVTPGKFDGDVIFARLSLEVFQIAKLEDKSFTASTGNVVRAVGTFTCGKPARIVARELGEGRQLWAEITLDSESKIPAPKKVLPGKDQEVPSARAKEKSPRR